jgi:hypothetical protein
MTIVYEFLSVFIVLCSFLGLGKFLSILFKLDKSILAMDGLLGAGIYSLSISIFGLFLSLFHITCVLIITGFVFFLVGLYRKWFNFHLKLPLVVVIYLIFALVMASYPSTYFDPLNYHLYGIVEWSKLDRLTHIKSAIQIMHNSYADYLYFPFSFWWGQSEIKELVSVQVSSQIFTVIFGITFFSFLMFELIKDKFEKIWVPLLIMAALTRASLQHKGFIAKNDWVALSWFLGAVYVLWANKINPTKTMLLSSIFMGLSVGTKLSYSVPATILYVWLLLIKKLKFNKSFLYSTSLIFLVIIPYLYRNYIWTRNPFFPLAHGLFPSNYLGPSWLEGFKYFDMAINDLSWELLQKKLIRIFTYEPIAYLGLLFPYCFFSLSFAFKSIWFLINCFLILFILCFGPGAELRHFGPVALMINIFGVYILSSSFNKLKIPERYKFFVSLFFLFLMVVNFFRLDNQLNPFPSSLRNGLLTPRTFSLVSEKKGYLISKNIKSIIEEDDRIALFDDTPPYYLSMYKIVRLWDDPSLDRDLKKCNHINCVVQVFNQENIQYLLDSGFIFDPYYNLNVLNIIEHAIIKYPQIVILNLNGERLISIKILNRILKNYEF